jgi:hypothetical protein
MDKDTTVEELEERIKLLEEQLNENRMFRMMDDLKDSEVPGRVRKLFTQQLMLLSDMAATLSRMLDDQPEDGDHVNKKGSRNIPVD